MEHEFIEIFCVCAPEDQKYLDQLKVHLASLPGPYPVRLWERSQALPGMHWKMEFNMHLSAACILLFLVSLSLLSLSFYARALQQALTGGRYVLPLLLHPASLQGTPCTTCHMFRVIAGPSSSSETGTKPLLKSSMR